MSIFPSKSQWQKWTLPSKAGYISSWIGGIAFLVMILLHFTKSPSTEITQNINGDFIAGDKNTYNTFIQGEISKTNKNNIVEDQAIRDFFLRLQLSLAQIRNSISSDKLKTYPKYLQRSYNMKVSISSSHGLGFEFTTPSQNPEINIVKTNMPIEKFYFSKYTSEENISKSRFFKVKGKNFVMSHSELMGGEQMIVLVENGDALLLNVHFKYSPNDTTKEIAL